MSFKNRLRTLFFLLTVVPLLAAAYTVQEALRVNGAKRVDAGLIAALHSAQIVYEADGGVTRATAARLAGESAVQEALAGTDGVPGAPNRPALINLLREAQTGLGVQIAALTPAGDVIAGDRSSGMRLEYVGRPAGDIGSIVVGVPLDAAFARRLSSGLEDIEVAFFDEASTIVDRNGPRTVDVSGLPEGQGTGTIKIDGVAYRAAVAPLAGSTPSARALAIYPAERLASDIRRLRVRVIIAATIAIVLILIMSEFILRAITGQIGMFARAARAVGEGDFAGHIPVQGNDEFSQFAGAFNRMSSELEQRIGELEDERRRVRSAHSRFGQALESSHDVAALYRILIESAMEAVAAGGGRLSIVDERSSTLVERLRLGAAAEPGVDLPAPGEGLESLVVKELAVKHSEDPQLIAAPLYTSAGGVLGVVTLVDPRKGTFTEADVSTLGALASQGATAIDNAFMHKTMEQQAATDSLTGLANYREFQDQLRRELDRAKRFGQPFSVVMFDLDDFKLVNDRYSHLAGDAVLRYVANKARGAIREIDLAARPGGEEFAILLPGTNADGAARVAERIRAAIAAEPAAVSDRRPVSVTASFGIASLSDRIKTQVELVAAADRALYAAKRAGKNRVIVFDPQMG